MTETMSKAGKPRSSTLSSLIMPLLYALVVIGVFASIALRLQSSERSLCSGVVIRAATELKDYMSELQLEASVMAASISKNPELPKSEAARIASSLLSSRPFVTGISLAPSALVRYHFPETDGESLIGHDLLSNPERRDALTQAMELKEPVFSGPFEALEEGSVLFIRYPVFSAGKFWGFVSVNVDFNGLVEDLALDASYPGFIFALAAVDQQESAQLEENVNAGRNGIKLSDLKIAGDSGAHKQGVTSALLDLPGLAWRLYTMPLKGWLALSPSLYLLGVAALAGAFFLFAWIRALGSKNQEVTKNVEPLFSLLAEQGKRLATPFPEVIDGPMSHLPREKATHPVVEPKPATRIEGVPGIESKPSTEPEPVPGAPQVPGQETVTIKFKGPSVKGQLYMPDVMFSGDPKDLFAHLRVVDDEGKAETKPKFEPEPARSQKAQILLDSMRKQTSGDKAKVSFGSVSILVVDDSEANRDIMGRMLSLRGYEPEFAASGEEALARCSAKEFSIIFMDCFMPGMDGYKTSELIRSSRVSARTQIIGMSARVGAQELERCKASGMKDLLSKPFTLSQLTAMIQGLAG